jgi:hypothetical protein
VEVFFGLGVSGKTGSLVRFVLESVEVFGVCAVEAAVAAVDSGGDQSMDESLGGPEGQGWWEAGDVSEVKEGGLCCLIEVGFEGEAGVKDGIEV